jgi:photosystem II stability/assembly factor-like uncharacterized protein
MKILTNILLIILIHSISYSSEIKWTKVYDDYLAIEERSTTFVGIDSADSLNIMTLSEVSGKVLGENNKFFAFHQIMKSTDGGLNWNRVFSDSILNVKGFLYMWDIAYPTLDFCITGGDSNYVIKTTNGGKDWKEYYLNIPYEPPRGIQEIRMLDEKHGVISTSNNIYISHDGFETYRRLDLPGRYVVIDLSILSSGSIKFLGREIVNDTARNQKLLYSTNEGDTWQEYDFSEYKYPRAMHFVDSLLGFVVGYEWTGVGGRKYDIIHRTTDGGKTWELQLDTILVVPSGLQEVDFLDRENGITVGQAGKIYWTHDAGKTWLYDSNAQIYSHQPATMYVTMLGKHTAVICDFLGRIFHSEFVSTGVEELKIGQIIAISPNPAGEYIVISGLNKGLQPLVPEQEIKIFNQLGGCMKFAGGAGGTHPLIPSQEGKIRIDVSFLPAGIYFIRVGDWVGRFLKI